MNTLKTWNIAEDIRDTPCPTVSYRLSLGGPSGVKVVTNVRQGN